MLLLPMRHPRHFLIVAGLVILATMLPPVPGVAAQTSASSRRLAEHFSAVMRRVQRRLSARRYTVKTVSAVSVRPSTVQVREMLRQRETAQLREALRETPDLPIPTEQQGQPSPPSPPIFRTRTSTYTQTSSSAKVAQLRQQILDLVNAERASRGLNALRMNSLLEQSAQGHASDMRARNYFSHTNPEGLNSLDRIRATGYLDQPCQCVWKYVTGENIAAGQQTPESVMRDWMNSQGHRDNILNPAFVEMGIGIDGDHWVQNFGVVQYQE